MKKTPVKKPTDSDIEVEYKKTLNLTEDSSLPENPPSPLNLSSLPDPKAQATSLSLETIRVTPKYMKIPGSENWPSVKGENNG